MKQFYSLIIATLLLSSNCVQGKNTLSPDKLYGKLYSDVQLKRIFDDSKTFADCIPLKNPEDILKEYLSIHPDTFSANGLRTFISNNFILPPHNTSTYNTTSREPITKHIESLWDKLQCQPDKEAPGSSLLPLHYSYIVPGGRFREIYYWDSYFTMLGLEASNRWDIIENMVKNFSSLIQTYGHIPNGNRTYYLSRSQPPFFCCMIQLLSQKKGEKVYSEYLSSMQKEYDYWMDRTAPTHHIVKMPDGSVLNRYYDQDTVPRQESYREDYEIARGESLKAEKDRQSATFADVCRNLRSGAESGWDFSSRWLSDGKNINTIRTIDYVPVDLNALLWNMELTLAHAYKITGNTVDYHHFLMKSEKRKKTIDKYCWSAKDNWYVDYNFILKKQSNHLTAAGVSPLFFNLATKKQSLAVGKTLKSKFLKKGGLITTLTNTGQQWDAPNGWAPLQWLAVKGLENYGNKALAREIAQRWIRLNIDVFNRTGKLMEKYNVDDTTLEAGGGEYSGQDGFGWTNGVLLKLLSIYGTETPAKTK